MMSVAVEATTSDRTPPGQLALRRPEIEDGPTLWSLARAAGGLDVNSPYAYLVLCRSFAETCVVAEADGRKIGFLSAFPPPEAPDTVFVWQVAVAPSYRRRGVAKAMLRALLERPSCAETRYVEATVTPDNRASQCLFQGLAAERGTACTVGEGFPRRLFPGAAHEPELLLRVGPID